MDLILPTCLLKILLVCFLVQSNFMRTAQIILAMHVMKNVMFALKILPSAKAVSQMGPMSLFSILSISPV